MTQERELTTEELGRSDRVEQVSRGRYRIKAAPPEWFHPSHLPAKYRNA